MPTSPLGTGLDVIERSPLPIVEPLREELAAAASGEWVLALDPDERVSTGLAAALREASVRDDVDAVEIPFTHFDFGYPPTHRLPASSPGPGCTGAASSSGPRSRTSTR